MKYRITEEPFLDEDSELQQQIESCHELALSGTPRAAKQIQKQIDRFPDSPALKNYLSICFTQMGQSEKARKVTEVIVEKHPDYLFGKANMAHYYIQQKQFNKVLELFGEEFDLKVLYPDRDVFHISEVKSLLCLSVCYYAEAGNVEKAAAKMEELRQLAPSSDETQQAEFSLTKAYLARMAEKMREEEKKKISVETKMNTRENNLSEGLPAFAHPEMELLYQEGLYIEKSNLDSVLALPRDALIKDLELILQDSIDRFAYWKAKDLDEETDSFVVHAFFILGEIEATQSLGAVLNFLSQGEELIRHYLGDFLTECMWDTIYKIGSNQMDVLLEFMKKPGIHTYSKTEVVTAIMQLALHQPAKRNEVIEWFREILSFYENCEIEDNIVDSDLIASMICDAIDIKGQELIPEIEKLYELDYVSIGICGLYSEVKTYLVKGSVHNPLRELLTIYDRYEKITSTWAGYNEGSYDYHNDHAGFEDRSYPDLSAGTSELVRTEPKIGRNDPCPCGSGKKYKKCCMD